MARHPEHRTPQPLFDLGHVTATPGALAALVESGESPLLYLQRHVLGDWRAMDAADQQENQRAVREGCLILSAYALRNGRRLWIITEWDRSATTLLLQEEY